MAETIIAIVSIILSLVGISVAIAIYVYVRCFAMKRIDHKLDSIQEAQTVAISKAYEQRVGIEPKKEVVIQQQIPHQESTLTTVTDSTYFVSYFGMCFPKEPLKTLGGMMGGGGGGFGGGESSQKFNVENTNKKMREIDEERGLGKPVQSIEIPKHERNIQNDQIQRNHNMTTPDNNDQNSVASSLSSEHQDIFRKTHSYQHQDVFRNNPNTTKEHSMKSNERNEDFFRTNPKNPPIEIENNKIHDKNGDLDLSEDSKEDSKTNEDDGVSYQSDNKMEYSDDDEDDSFKTPEENEQRSPLYNGHKKKFSEDSQPQNGIDSQGGLSPNNDIGIQHNDGIISKNLESNVTMETGSNIPMASSSESQYRTENEIINYTKTFQSENQSYFSSDEEKSSSTSDDDYYHSAAIAPYGEDEFDSPKYLVHKLDSSLSIPDLAHSSSSSGSGGDSGDWELSSSSEDRSEKEEKRRQRQRMVTFDGSNDGNGKSASHSFQESIDTQQQHNQPSTDICPFCGRKYIKEEGVKFSFDEKCDHLMCMNCCEDGKAAEFNGECPICNLQTPAITSTSIPPSKSLAMPPRSGEKKQEQVIMAI